MTGSKPIKILMTGAGAPGGPGIFNCLQQDSSFNITAADADANAAGKYKTGLFEKIPLAGDPDYIHAVLAVCKKRNINIILPLVTRELIPLAKAEKEFIAAGIKLPLSPLASLEIANDKGRLYQFLEWRGIAVPGYKIIDGNAPDAVVQFSNSVKELGYPGKAVCFKPSVSNGSRGFRIIDASADEAAILFQHKPTSVYTSFENAVRILSAASFPELLISEYLPGEEYSVDCLANRGEAVLIVPRLRKKMINGISVEGEFVNDESIIRYCTAIIRELQLHGNIGIQVKRSAAGRFLILEINPRVQGSISAGLGAGINLPVLAIKQEMGLPILPDELTVKWGTKFSRHWQEAFW